MENSPFKIISANMGLRNYSWPNSCSGVITSDIQNVAGGEMKMDYVMSGMFVMWTFVFVISVALA